MDNKKFFSDNEYDLFRIKYTSEPSDKLVDFLTDTVDTHGVVFGFQFMGMLKSFTASGYELVNFLDKYSEISRKFNEPFVKELKAILSGDLDDFAKIKKITEAKDRKDLKRVREGIVSNKNGDKTFEELYGSSIETDEDDDINANMYAHCFESIANKSAKRRILESTGSSRSNKLKEEVESSKVYDYFMGLSSGRGMSPKSAAKATVNHFKEEDDEFGPYDLLNALDGDYDFDDLF